ncbi:ABC transporter ATP-binding protein [Candidatus Poribacteria bacterium]|nr:ABC transporter ATP-binding protein [Candidatus Poribacteria bacterium]
MSPLLTIHNLRTYFFLDEGTVRAVDGVSLQIPRGKTVAIVGESGCGKSVTAFSILRLVSPPGQIVSGEIVLHRSDGDVVLTNLEEDGKAIREIRGKEIAMIFQEPMTSLSPVHTVGKQIMEAVTLHTQMRKTEAKSHAIHMMEQVDIPNPKGRFEQYPHEMSGGLRQRAVIAMALACQPALLIADEPTTALDVTIQAQILALMRELQAEFGMSILLITHDLGVVAEMADEVAVMYMGREVEQAPMEQLLTNPQHPYTQALLQSVPGRGTQPKAKLKVIAGSIPEPFQRIPGCAFHPRCQEAIAGACNQGEAPPLLELSSQHHVACIARHDMKSDIIET